MCEVEEACEERGDKALLSAQRAFIYLPAA